MAARLAFCVRKNHAAYLQQFGWLPMEKRTEEKT